MVITPGLRVIDFMGDLDAAWGSRPGSGGRFRADVDEHRRGHQRSDRAPSHDGTTVAALIGELGLGDRRVAVERNREVVPRAEHATTVLAAGDRLELVTFVGGG